MAEAFNKKMTNEEAENLIINIGLKLADKRNKKPTR